MDLDKLTFEQIVIEYDKIRFQEEEIASTKKVLQEEIISRMKRDSEIVGNYIVTKVKKYKFDMEIDKARDLGITKIVPEKEEIDQSKAKALWAKGVELPHTIIFYPLVKEQEAE
jgi:hypothetical protein